MLYLTRRCGEAVVINNEIEIQVVELRGRTVKLGFSFPTSASIMRKEVFDQVRADNQAAARATREAMPAGGLEQVVIDLDLDAALDRDERERA